MLRAVESNRDVQVVLRPATDADVDAIAAVQAAQDIEWWGTPDGDINDARAELDRVLMAMGSLDRGARVAVVRGVESAVVGFALLTGHGHTNLAIDSSASGAVAARRLLVDWLTESGGTQIDAPVQDLALLNELEKVGYRPTRSSFELERHADVADLGPTVWPDGIGPAPFRLGVDDEEVHALIYPMWTDVEGHTDRPLDEWRALLLHEASFVPELAVLARRNEGSGPVVGVAMCRTFAGGIGWVNQLAVGYPDRGVGLGRALLVESFHRLMATGVEILGLGVEAANVNALGLYRTVGLEVAREWVHCSPT
jgi:ribosomal protein S18 acetylase RimI-like enzyme